MNTLQVLAAGVAAMLLAAPLIPQVLSWLQAKQKSYASYRDAIGHLADVRSRLVATDALKDDQKKAIDILTLALVDGSDL